MRATERECQSCGGPFLDTRPTANVCTTCAAALMERRPFPAAPTFTRGDRVAWAAPYLELGRGIDPKWYEDELVRRGTVELVQRGDGDVVVRWDGQPTPCVIPPHRLAKLVFELSGGAARVRR